MLEFERFTMIRALLTARAVVSVGELSKLTGASAATARRDINALAERGELRRVYGGAAALDVPAILPLPQGDEFAAQKRAIARAAAGLVEDGRGIILNGGSTMLAMSEHMAGRELDVLTNSFAIAARLAETSKCRVSVPGGTLCRPQNIIVSPFEHDASENFWAWRMFTGAYSVNRHGMMESDPLMAQAASRLMRRAEQLVVLADSRKLRRQSSLVTAELSRIHIFITDGDASDAELAPLRDAGVEVIVVTA